MATVCGDLHDENLITAKVLFNLNEIKTLDAKPDQIDAIRKENENHHDMLLPDVEESYHAVGLKELSSFNWINQLDRKNIQWIIKMDDDIMLNFTKLDDYLSEESNKAIHCRVLWHNKVRSNPGSKW